MCNRILLLLLLFFLNCPYSNAQFFLNGNAMVTNDSCYQLTEAENWQVGSIWNGEKIDLSESFELVVDIFAGCKDLEGADGIVFGLQPISTSIGTAGGDLGFGEVTPSLGVEFDSYQNIDYEDPTFDHIAIIRDGILRHNTPQGSLAGPVQANPVAPNIEDCQYHPMQITWDATNLTLSVYFDCELRLSYTGDIVNDIFNGDPLVFWGFTSATGGLNNRQEICFSYTSFIDGLVDQTICPGEEVPLQASGGIMYQWSPAEGLSDPTIANPIATPTETTLYTVEIIDDCGIPFYDDVLITVDNNQFDVEILTIPSDITEVVAGNEFTLTANIIPSDEGNYTYEWSSAIGSTFSQPDSATTNVISSLDQVGTETFTILVTSENGCTSEAQINIDILGLTYQIPNVFTPNGDNVNDAFGPVTNGDLDAYYCKIYDRWGQVIFETNNPTERWDGTFQGEASPSDIYIYLINLELGGNRFEEKGDLTLIR